MLQTEEALFILAKLPKAAQQLVFSSLSLRPIGSFNLCHSFSIRLSSEE